MINFQDFQKINLRIAKIIKAEKVEGSEKLLRLEIDLGSGQELGQGNKQIVAGLALFYSPEDLIGREIAVVVNLEPKTVFGVESQGMLLAADDNGRPVLLVPDKEVPVGTKIH